HVCHGVSSKAAGHPLPRVARMRTAMIRRPDLQHAKRSHSRPRLNGIRISAEPLEQRTAVGVPAAGARPPRKDRLDMTTVKGPGRLWLRAAAALAVSLVLAGCSGAACGDGPATPAGGAAGAQTAEQVL